MDVVSSAVENTPVRRTGKENLLKEAKRRENRLQFLGGEGFEFGAEAKHSFRMDL